MFFLVQFPLCSYRPYVGSKGKFHRTTACRAMQVMVPKEPTKAAAILIVSVLAALLPATSCPSAEEGTDATTRRSQATGTAKVRDGEFEQSVRLVTDKQPTVPILVGNPRNLLSRITVVVPEDGIAHEMGVKAIRVKLAGTLPLKDVQKVEVYYSGPTALPRAWENPDPLFEARLFGEPVRPTASLTFAGRQELAPGANYFWIACTLNPGANIDASLGAACESVELQDGTTLVADAGLDVHLQRLGVALRKSGDDNVHTYRIPGLATTNEGTLIAVYDIRRKSSSDLPGDVDIGMSRSEDGGITWQPMQVIMDHGQDPEWKYDGNGDPAVLVDRQTGTIWVAAVWSHGDRGWHHSGPGLDPSDTGQFVLVSSTDDGQTWSRPINITSQIKRPEWSYLLQGPGKGITMEDGTIVFPAQYQDSPDNSRLPRSTIVYSKDHGKTWRIGTGAYDDTTEAQVIELAPGYLMLNCRYNRSPYRVVMVTRDLGATWEEHPTSRGTLIEPITCMASLINVDRELGGESFERLLFSNPNSLVARTTMTVKASVDGGSSWPASRQLLLDSGKSAGYSCMSMIDRDTCGILYEGSQAHLIFQRIKLHELFD